MHFLTHKFQSNFNWPCPNRSQLSDQDEVQFSVDAMSNAGRGGRKEQGGTWEKQTGDFPVRWLLPLKRPPCRCSLPRLSAFRFLLSSFVRLSFCVVASSIFDFSLLSEPHLLYGLPMLTSQADMSTEGFPINMNFREMRRVRSDCKNGRGPTSCFWWLSCWV